MSDEERHPPTAKDRRAERLRSALRENLRRRKTQARARQAESRDNHDTAGPEGPTPERPSNSPDLPPTGPRRS